MRRTTLQRSAIALPSARPERPKVEYSEYHARARVSPPRPYFAHSAHPTPSHPAGCQQHVGDDRQARMNAHLSPPWPLRAETE